MRHKLRNLLSRLMYIGPLFGLWLRWKSDKQTREYHHVLLSAVNRDSAAVSAAESWKGEGDGKSPGTRGMMDASAAGTAALRFVPLPNLGSDHLRKLLFICDNMWEERELLPELRKICEVTFVDVHPNVERPGGAPFEKLAHAPVEARLTEAAQEKFDAAIVYLRSTLLTPELVGLIKHMWRCPVIGLNLDCKTTFKNYNVFRGAPVNYRARAGLFDCNLTNARAMLDVYAAAGLPAVYLPTGYHYDPAAQKPPTEAKFEIPFSFVGSWKPEREELIEKLCRIGIPIQVFGGGWNGAPFMRDAWRIYQRSQLNLGIGYNVPAARFTNLKNRDFECPGSGGCYLTTFDWELAGLFDIGKEILCYRSTDDLVELYTYYIRRPEECLRIAKAGFERCMQEHTWEQRFRRAFEQLGFKLASL